MSEQQNIDRIGLEIDTEAGKSSNGIDSLIQKLTKLKGSTKGVAKSLNLITDSLNGLATAAHKANSVNFTGLQQGLNSLANTFNRVNKNGKSLSSTGDDLKKFANSLNSARGSMTKLSESSKQVNSINFTGLQRGLNSIVGTVGKVNRTGGDISSTAETLKNLSKSLNSSRKAIGNLADSSKELKKADISGFTKQMMELSKLSKYSNDMVQFKEATSSLNRSLNSLNKGSKVLQEFINSISKLENLDNFQAKVSKLVPSLNQLATAMSNAKNASQGFNKSTRGSTNALGRMNAMFKGNLVGSLASTFSLYEIGRALGYCFNQANSYIETMNMFNVVMGTSSKKAWNFIQSLETIGVDMNEAMRFQSAFYDISKSLGMASDNAYTLSEQFTKLSYDYASLYDKNPYDMFIKLQSAVVGEIEPIRQLGKDISETRLQQIAWNLGINENIRNMDQASKAELRFIAIMMQSGAAMNDMERTINSPANALRVLRAQFRMLTIEIGNLFIPILMKILPVVIAVVKVLRMLARAVAGLFGIKLPSINFGQKDTIGITDEHLKNMGVNSNDLADSTGRTAKNTGRTAKNLKKSRDAMKKLKDFATGIDELNVLKKDEEPKKPETPTGGGTGGGVGGVGGVGDLGGIGGDGLGLDLEDFGYETLLQNVKMKADEIYESFQKWLIPLGIIAGILTTMFAINKIAQFINYVKDTNKNFNLIKTTLSTIGGKLDNVFGFKKLGSKIAQLTLFQKALNGIKSVASSMGEKFTPVLTGIKGIGTKAKDSLLSITGLNKGFKTFATRMGAIGLVAGVIIGTIALVKTGMEQNLDAEGYAELFTNFASSIGEKIQAGWEAIKPILEGVLKAVPEIFGGLAVLITEKLPDIISGISTWVSTNGPKIVETLGELAKGILKWTGDLLSNIIKKLPDIISKLATWVTTYAPKIVDKLLGIATAVLKWLGNLILDIIKKLPSFLLKFGAWVITTTPKIIVALGTIWLSVVEWVLKLIGTIITTLAELVVKLGTFIIELPGKIKSKASDMADKFLNFVKKDVIKPITDKYEDFKTKLSDLITNLPTNIKNKVVSMGESIYNFFKDELISPISEKYNDIKSTISDIIDNLPDNVKTKVSDMAKTVKGFFKNYLVDPISEKYNDIKSTISDVIDNLPNNVKTKISDMGATVKGFFKDYLVDPITSKYSSIKSKFKDTIKAIPGHISKTISNIGKKIKNAFKSNVIDPIANELKEFADDPLGYVGKTFAGIANKIKGKGSIDVNYSIDGSNMSRVGIPQPAPVLTAFATGGFVPRASSFISPDAWTAGEAGKELIGTYKGRTTVMPLERTSFVTAIHDAVYTAVKSAEEERETKIVVKPELKLDSKDIAQGQDEYNYKSGGGLVKKRGGN